MSRVKVGKHFLNAAGTNTVLQYIAPASNTQGVILRTISLLTGPSAILTEVIVYADTVAPSLPADASKRYVAVARSISTNTATSTIVPYEIEVPAGLGVWVGFNSTSISGGANISWDFVEA